MHDQATFEMLLRIAVFALPAAALLTLILAWFARVRNRARRQHRDGTPLAPPGRGAAAPVVPLPVRLPDVPVADAPEVAKSIEAALAAGNRGAVAGLYLDLALSYEKLGDGEARMTALRSAAGHASLHGPHACHAAARLQLAEAAYCAGDLTSACEQWQMARSAFLEDGQMEEHARVDRRMRENGCPTDWVLTDF